MPRMIRFISKFPVPLIIVILIPILLAPVLTLPQPTPKDPKTKPPSPSTPTSSPLSSPSPSPSPVIPLHFGRILEVPILEYHYIADNPNPADLARNGLSVSPDKFRAQMEYLSRNGYHTISLNTFYAALKGGELPSKPVILTFDDGYIDFYTNAYPIMHEFGLTSVSFIPTSLIGGGYYMNWSQVEELARTGLVEFESHSLTHPNMTTLSTAELAKQMSESKSILSSHVGTPVNFIAYPYGTSNNMVQQAAKQAGYVGAIGTWYSHRNSEGTLYNLGRVKISGAWSLEEFAKRL